MLGPWSGLAQRYRSVTDAVPPGVLAVSAASVWTRDSLPYTLRFCPAASGGNLLAVGEEGGLVWVTDTLRESDTTTSASSKSVGFRPLAQWFSHANAVFDICWRNGDAEVLTASGDMTVALWNVERQSRIRSFVGHTQSVKSCHVSECRPDLVFASSRDGTVLIWDTRSSSPFAAIRLASLHKPGVPEASYTFPCPAERMIKKNCYGAWLPAMTPTQQATMVSSLLTPDFRLPSLSTIAAEALPLPPAEAPPTEPNPHSAPPQRAKSKIERSQHYSVTCVRALRDGCHVVTSGSADGCVKVHDLRSLQPVADKKTDASNGSRKRSRSGSSIEQVPSKLSAGPKVQKLQASRTVAPRLAAGRTPGVTWIALDESEAYMACSVADSSVHLYSMPSLITSGGAGGLAPIAVLTGHQVRGSYFIKCCISPDGCFVASGSVDHNAHIWRRPVGGWGRADSPVQSALVSGPEGEVMAVEWSNSEPTCFVGCVDDQSVHMWRLRRRCYAAPNE